MKRTTFDTSTLGNRAAMTDRRTLAGWPTAMLCLAPLLGSACQSTPTVAFRYEYAGCLGDGATKLIATATAPGRTLDPVEYSPPGPGTQSIALRLPTDLSGTISVVLEAKDANNCLLASGSTTVDLSVKRDPNNPADDIKVPLSCLSAPDCSKPPTLDPTTQPELLWSLRCGSDGDDVGTGTAFDEQGNVYVVGSFSGRAAGPACTFTGKAGDPNRHLAKLTGGSFLIKLNPDGVVQWSRTLGGIQGTAPAMYHVQQPWLSVTPGGEIYVAGVASQSARLETATTSLADGPFVARFNNSGTLSWQKSFGSVMTGTTRTRIGAVRAGSRNGQTVLALAGDCYGSTVVTPNDCMNPKQFVMYFEGTDRLNNITAKLFGEARLQAGSIFKHSITSVSLGLNGRTVLTGANQDNGISEADSGVSPQQSGSSMYVIRGGSDGTWSGGFTVQATQPSEFNSNNPGDLLPYQLERKPNHNFTSAVDRQGNIYIAASFHNNSPQPRIQKFTPDGLVADWTSSMITQDLSSSTHGHPVALSLDNNDHPILVFSYARLWTLGGMLDLNAPSAGGYVSDLAIIKYSKLYDSGTLPNFLWKTPIRITLGNYGLLDFQSHPQTNRIALVSRTKNASVLLDDEPLQLAALSGKADKYDLVLLVMGPPVR